MGEIFEFEKEKLIIGVIYSDKKIFDTAMEKITDKFGDYDMVSEEFSFSEEFSNYYDGELGGEGMRRIYSFDKLVDASEQAEIKEWTNALELELAVDANFSESVAVSLTRAFIDDGFIYVVSKDTTKQPETKDYFTFRQIIP